MSKPPNRIGELLSQDSARLRVTLIKIKEMRRCARWRDTTRRQERRSIPSALFAFAQPLTTFMRAHHHSKGLVPRLQSGLHSKRGTGHHRGQGSRKMEQIQHPRRLWSRPEDIVLAAVVVAVVAELILFAVG
jgi:hypothetical protein